MKRLWKAWMWLAYASSHLVYLLMQYSLSTQGWTRYASHFNLQGKADGWSAITPNTLPGSALLYLAVSIGTTLLVYILPRVFPRRWVSLPHPEFWRQSPNFEHAMSRCFSVAVWIQSLAAAHLTLVTVLTLQANHRNPVAMNVVPLYLSTAVTLLLIYGLVILLFVRLFKKKL